MSSHSSTDSTSTDEMVESDSKLAADTAVPSITDIQTATLTAMSLHCKWTHERAGQVRIMFYIFMCYYATAGSFDIGAVTACLPLTIQDFHVKAYTLVGLLGSIGSYGLIAALPLVGYCFNSTYFADNPSKSKHFLLGLLSFMALAVFGPICLAPSFMSLLFGKFLLGAGQSAFDVFVPVWIEQYAPGDRRATWMGLRNIQVVLGVLFSYAFCSSMGLILQVLTWRQCFAVQGLCAVALVLGLWRLTPNEIYRVSASSLGSVASLGHSTGADLSEPLILASNDENILMSPSGTIDTASMVHCSLGTRLYDLATNPNWIACTVSLMTVFAVATGLQFWTPEYLRLVFLADDPHRESKILITMLTLSSTASAGGIVFGGMCIDKMGGYDGVHGKVRCYRVLLICGVVSTCAGMYARTLSGAHHFILFCVLLWILLFAGSFTVGPMQGMIINSTQQNAQTTANSISQILLQFGCSIGPVLPGFVIGHLCEHSAGPDTSSAADGGVSPECIRFAMGPLLCGGLASGLALSWALILEGRKLVSLDSV